MTTIHRAAIPVVGHRPSCMISLMFSRRRFAMLGVALAVAGTALVGCSDSDSTSAPVRFMVANRVINLGHTQLAVAAENGYYGKSEVKYLTSDGTAATVQSIASGTADMGQADTLALAAAAAKGVKSVTAVCSYVAANIYQLLVSDSSDIRSVKDLKGKRIGMTSLGTGTYYNAVLALKSVGLTEKDVKFVTIGSPQAQLDALKKGQLDALSAIDVSIGTFQNLGAKLRTLDFDGATKWQWNVVVAKNDFLKKRPDAVAAVCKGIQSAELFVTKNPAAALASFKDWGGDVGTLSESQNINIIKSRSVTGFVTHPEGDDKWGWLPVDEMDGLAKSYQQLGLYDKPVVVSSIYTNELLDKVQPDKAKVDTDLEEARERK
ncbi:MAG: PhnD/SsuA/transferrin family substrate-binding protein [Streptosporangiales bacterium]|nr:PhnD/SsuA/transferrin family substrate-binding protein [Streptosporangiales bacterium]